MFWRESLPTITVPIYRTYYRKIAGKEDYAVVWKTRNRVELLGGVTTIGRDRTNNIILSDGMVSRQHAVIRYEENDFVIYDLTTANPVQVNDQEIQYRTVLEDGDVIEFLGSYLMEFQQWGDS